MNRINKLKIITDSDANVIDLHRDKNTLPSPLRYRHITDRNNKSPINTKHNSVEKTKINHNKQNFQLKYKKNVSENQNQLTHYPQIGKKNINSEIIPNVSQNSLINYKTNAFFQNNFYKINLNNQQKNKKNINFILTNYYSNTTQKKSDYPDDIDKKNNSNNLKDLSIRTDYDNKPRLYNSSRFSQENILNSEKDLNDSLSSRNTFSSQNKLIISRGKFDKSERDSSKNKDWEENLISSKYPNKQQDNENTMRNSKTSMQKYDTLNKNSAQFIISQYNNYTAKNKPININPQLISENLLSKLNLDSGCNYYDFPTNSDIPIHSTLLMTNYHGYENAKSSNKNISSIIKAYAVNTFQGIVRNYNEDRVSIILNISKPPKFPNSIWPKCSFFAIYDGHGGAQCADFLRDNLHNYVINDPSFPLEVKDAIRNGFLRAENDFMNNLAMNKYGDIIDKSGSCAIVIFIVDDICYVANVGDSRAIMSSDNGKNCNILSTDHKPEDEEEKKRVIRNGGKVYQTQTPVNLISPALGNNQKDIFLGPSRVFPGRLSISRSFGDIEAKRIDLGGNPNVIICDPEIKVIKIESFTDFIILGCDGIFDQIKSEEAIRAIWTILNEEHSKNKTIHNYCSMGVDLIMKASLVRKTLDNITVLMIAFENFENFIKKKNFEFEKLCQNYSDKRNLNTINEIDNFKAENRKNSTTSIFRLETENYTSTNHFDKKKNVENVNSLNNHIEKLIFRNTKSTLNTINNSKNIFDKKPKNLMIDIDSNFQNHLKNISRSVQANKRDLIQNKSNKNTINKADFDTLPLISNESNEHIATEEITSKNNFYTNIFSNEEQKKQNNLKKMKIGNENSKLPTKIISLENLNKISTKSETNNEDNSPFCLIHSQNDDFKYNKTKHVLDKIKSNRNFEKNKERFDKINT